MHVQENTFERRHTIGRGRLPSLNRPICRGVLFAWFLRLLGQPGEWEKLQKKCPNMEKDGNFILKKTKNGRT